MIGPLILHHAEAWTVRVRLGQLGVVLAQYFQEDARRPPVHHPSLDGIQSSGRSHHGVGAITPRQAGLGASPLGPEAFQRRR